MIAKNFKDIENYIYKEKFQDTATVRKRMQQELTVTFMDVGSTTTRIFVMDKGSIRDEKHFNTGVRKVNKDIELELVDYINSNDLPLCIVGAAGYGLGKIRQEIIDNKPTSILALDAIKNNGWVIISSKKLQDITSTSKTTFKLFSGCLRHYLDATSKTLGFTRE